MQQKEVSETMLKALGAHQGSRESQELLRRKHTRHEIDRTHNTKHFRQNTQHQTLSYFLKQQSAFNEVRNGAKQAHCLESRESLVESAALPERLEPQESAELQHETQNKAQNRVSSQRTDATA